jgi:hypothetical protein
MEMNRVIPCVMRPRRGQLIHLMDALCEKTYSILGGP